jgi:hypothetical protein
MGLVVCKRRKELICFTGGRKIMWNECKGFIAIMAIFALAACLIIIGMCIEREASNKELPKLKPQINVYPQPENIQ